MSAGGGFGCLITHWGWCSQDIFVDVGDKVLEHLGVSEMVKAANDVIDGVLESTELRMEAFVSRDTPRVGVNDSSGLVDKLTCEPP